MSRPSLNEDGDPIFEIPSIFLPDPPSNLDESLFEQYMHKQHTLLLLRDIWFVQLGNPAHRNYWNIRAAHKFWVENGPVEFNGGRKLGWWFEGEGEGDGEEDESGWFRVEVGVGNWITWGIERLEGELIDMVTAQGRGVHGGSSGGSGGKSKEKPGQNVKVVMIEEDEEDEGSVGVVGEVEEISVGSTGGMFSSSGASPLSVREVMPRVPPGSPKSVRYGGSDGGYGPQSSQGLDPNPEANERLAEYIRMKDLDADGDYNIVESIKTDTVDGTFRVRSNNHRDNQPFMSGYATNPQINNRPVLRPSSKSSGGKRDLSPNSDSSGGILIKDPNEDADGRVRKSPKRSKEVVKGDASERAISISSSRSASSKTLANDVIEI